MQAGSMAKARSASIRQCFMSAPPSKADMGDAAQKLRFVPKTEIGTGGRSIPRLCKAFRGKFFTALRTEEARNEIADAW